VGTFDIVEKWCFCALLVGAASKGCNLEVWVNFFVDIYEIVLFAEGVNEEAKVEMRCIGRRRRL
jgi:hypothetical protein